MDLSLSDEEIFLAESVRGFVRRRAQTEELVRLQAAAADLPSTWTRAMAEAGWLGILVPENVGGMAGSALQTAVIAEELGRGPVPGPFLAASVVAASLLTGCEPTPERDDLLAGIASGDAVVVPALTPAERTWDGLVSEVVPLGAEPGGLVGTFPFVSQGAAATHLLVPVRGDAEGVEFAALDSSEDAVTIRALPGFLDRCSAIELAGAHATSHLRIGRADLDRALSISYAVVSAYAVGGCQELLERSIAYSSTRVQFGRAIGKFQRVQDHIVDLVNALDAARWMTYEALWHVDSDGGQQALAAAHRAKAVAAEAYITCADAAHKVHGGLGMDPDFGITLFTQQSRSLYSYLGDPRWHKRRMGDALGWSRG
jgi:alkylation response protein AidB-like acyl-CoA dehydrogenase